MTALKIIAIVLGLAFTLFGYFIFFKGKYSLINGFNEAQKAGTKNQDYAKRVGLTEFILGIVILLAAVILLLFA